MSDQVITLNEVNSRETFKTKMGFIWSCVGSAVGVGNVWLFPYRLGQYGGAVFLIEYIIFAVILGYFGAVSEMAFGRSMKAGPIEAFAKAIKMKFNNSNCKIWGYIPVIGSWLIAVGYSVVVGWILHYFINSITGSLLRDNVTTIFSNMANNFGNVPYHLLSFACILCILIFGISNGIEKLNKFVMPLFFILFIILAINSAFLPNSIQGYAYLFNVDFSKFLQPDTWIMALGTSFFSLSLAGSGTLIYGSYLRDDEDISICAKCVVIFDTIAGLVAGLAIIPAVFSFGLKATEGPALLFITMPKVFASMPFGYILEVIFFLAVLFAAVTSIVNLFEVPIEALQNKFKLSRKTAVIAMISFSAIVGIFVENGEIVGRLMDIISVYFVPSGALLAAIMFFWFCGDKFAMDQINLGAKKKIGNWFTYMIKYVFVGITLFIFVSGVIKDVFKI